jgi:hypothetical protein
MYLLSMNAVPFEEMDQAFVLTKMAPFFQSQETLVK